ncbi:hypothetical protein [Armatimonas rosea]|uniref:Uncharacterized protein n=1 Tax=Armatimonas rosea TaxID=685828 RepID=A0A7W9SMM1_ARMRO|nr:hypothetical protein [Armatimonas rosea]MBB6048628.1 hypothetical protein [Armatimonas rosea]
MTSRELQQWRTQLKSLLATGDIDGAALHALSFPTPAYRLRCLIYVCREVREPERVQALLARAQEQVALISQPQAQSHAWGRLCRTYAKHHLLNEAGCALLVADPYARKAHLGYLIQLYRYERRYAEALQLCETWREVAEPHERSLIETLVELLDLPLEKKRRQLKRSKLPPQPLDIDSALLKAIIAARGQEDTEKAVYALLNTTGYTHSRPPGNIDRELFRRAMHHAHRWVRRWRRSLEWLCFWTKEPELGYLFDDALLKAAREQTDPTRRAAQLQARLWTARFHKDQAALESLLEEVRTAIRTIPDLRQREHAFTFLGCHLHWLGWRGKRLSWEDGAKT